MTLTELRYIVTLAQEQHFGHAAERCHVSQPTLSVGVKKLEDELGVLTESFNTMTAQLAQAQSREQESRRAIETTRAYLESVLGNLSAGVLVFDDAHRLRMVNASAAVILQQPVADLIGLALADWGKRLPGLAPFAEAFAIAVEAGLLSTPHAGELAGPESVRGALDVLKADRLQHGVRAVEDPELVKRLADEQICCDVCPTSNVLLSVVPAMEASALGPLLDAGVPCSVNADDPLLFGPGLLEEYQVCRDALGFDDARMAHIARCSIEHSGAPADVKASTLSAIDAWLAYPA